MKINYNAFKSPVEINEEGKERISFQYNAGLQRAHMYYGSTATEKMDRPYRRHYSEDGTMEITEDIQNGTTNFVFYLGGDAYNAPAIWKEIHHSNAQPLDAQLYFLHRDHLGSIVMITDAAGNVAEKRQFDAWGNIVKLEDGNGVPLSAFVILDRGYTGHEHLLGVGLIHMNGRLYDPKLHRFLQPDNYVQDPYNSQNFNRYGYVYNNPLSHVDPSGEFIHLIVGAVIGGVINWAANGAKFSWKGLAHFGIGALAGAAAAGIGAGVNVAMAGGSFGAGFMGTAAGVSSTGFIAGAATGASAGFTNGFVSGIGNTALNGGNIGESLGAGFKNGFKQGIAGGITGGVFGGIDALTKDVNFFTGKANMDLSNGIGAHNISNTNQSVSSKYVGKYEGTNVYESSQLGSGRNSGGITLPGKGIVVGKGAFSNTMNRYTELMQHEFGHILQAKEIGNIAFYKVIGKQSLVSASLDGVGSYAHRNFWTETWANYLSSQYFGSRYLYSSEFPIKNISSALRLNIFFSTLFPF
ncbi:RHS repeat domain-containing protein [Pedobacter aquae]|uniref:RHS repeat domain-containing protein n=1 Tax=Pedobacter aquae TaxID=2605747 RepID=UPI001980B5D0|nr:RHS repeat-associated core domain-containing protein [Pedobacter aquae]